MYINYIENYDSLDTNNSKYEIKNVNKKILKINSF